MKFKFIILSILCVFYGCKEKSNDKVVKNSKEAKSTTDSLASKKVPQPPLQIKYYAVRDKDSILQIDKYFNDSQLKIILAINRIDFAKLYGAEMLSIPDTFLYNLKYYSPYPDSIQLLDSVYKIMLVSYPAQAIGMYEKGKLIRWMPTSMGKKSTPTPTGLFHANWKSKQTNSTDDSSWVLKWYFNLDNFRGVSLHQYELPGHPASHACMRLYDEDAEWLYYWAEQWKLDSAQVKILAYGTPVIIFGNYDFDQLPPWYSLPSNPKQVEILPDILSVEINKYLPTILKRQADRDSFIYSKDTLAKQ